jgi:hypothetical protein
MKEVSDHVARHANLYHRQKGLKLVYMVYMVYLSRKRCQYLPLSKIKRRIYQQQKVIGEDREQNT